MEVQAERTTLTTTRKLVMSTTKQTKESFIRAYATRELAEMYGVSPKTMRNWLKPHMQSIGQRKGWYFNTRQVRIIFDKLGHPDTFNPHLATA